MKNIQTKSLTKKPLMIVFAILFIALASIFSLLQSNQLTAFAQDEVHLHKGYYSLEDIRQMLGEPDWEADEYMREYLPEGGVQEYPMLPDEIYEMQNGIQRQQDGAEGIQAAAICSVCGGAICNATPTRTIIRQSSKANPIIVVLFADGFTAGTGANQIGTWNASSPNPTANSFFWHAKNAMDTMLSTYPYNLYADYFTFIADQTISAQQGVSICYGSNQTTVNNFWGSYVPSADSIRATRLEVSGGTKCARNLAQRNGSVNLIQVVANTTLFGGVAWTSHNLTNPVLGVALSTVHTTYGGWQRTLMHEFGHSYGSLADEYNGATGREAPNMTADNTNPR